VFKTKEVSLVKVGLLSTAWERVPPIGYGGIESMVWDLVIGIQGLDDIEFSLFSVAATTKNQDLEKMKVSVGYYFESGQYLEIGSPEKKIWIEAVHDLAARKWMEEQGIDVLHIHAGVCPTTIMWAASKGIPVLITLHGPLDMPLVQSFYNMISQEGIYFNSISDAQRRAMVRLNYIDTIHHGIAVDPYPFVRKKRDYFLVIGRITPKKGQLEAIDVAKSLGKSLIIAGSPEDTEEGLDYWEKEISPRVDKWIDGHRNKLHSVHRYLGTGDVIYFGEADFSQKVDLFGNAAATLMPISWEEPFGLVMIESLACGTPVVGFHRGSVPEIVEHGKTGFIVNDIKQMIEAARRVGEISPEHCRKSAETRFSNRVMARKYLELYRRILEKKT